jgi:hypothetical protein
VLCSKKGGNYLKKSNLYLYTKNIPNIVICSELILTQKIFFSVISSLFTAKFPIIFIFDLLDLSYKEKLNDSKFIKNK